MNRTTGVVWVAAAFALSGCAARPSGDLRDAAQPAASAQTFELLPHVRINKALRMVEFDGVVPLDCHHPDTPDVYLELIACSHSREHESLVLSRARPSHIHAGLLAVGAAHGRPGVAGPDRREATGDAVHIRFRWEDENCNVFYATPADWIQNEGDSIRGWVFSGSQLRDEGMYSADGTGVLIGLSTFGDEVIALRDSFSPDLASGDIAWLADNDAVPKVRTPVVVELWLDRPGWLEADQR